MEICLASLRQEGAPITIYDPLTGAPFPNNTIPADRISPQATALLSYIPEPNPKLPGQFQNYQRITSSESNSTRVGVRFLHSFGPSSGGSPIGGLIRQYMGQGGSALRQSVNVNFNYSHAAADELDVFPELGGKQQSHQYSLALGYSIGKGRLTTNPGLNWNRSQYAAFQLFHRQHRYCQPDRHQRTAGEPTALRSAYRHAEPVHQLHRTAAELSD